MEKNFEVGYKIALIICFLVVGFFIVYSFFGISSDGKSCLRQPLVWGAEVASEKFGGSASCSCSVSDKVLVFDEEGIVVQDNAFVVSNDSLFLGG